MVRQSRLGRGVVRALLASLLAMSLGCYASREPGVVPSGPCGPETAYEAPRCEGPGRCVDVLFVMDNRESMLEEQVALFEQVPRLVTALATGDLDADGAADIEPVTDLHFGAVTSDLGSGGVFVDGCLSPDFGDDGIVGRGRTGRLSDVCGLTIPPFLAYAPGADLDDFTLDAACSVTVGIFGCPFAQPLDSALKALSESPAPVSFYRGTCGHADGDNAGFLREDSILLAVLYTDHDDCSVADPSFFADRAVGATADPGLVCDGAAEALHPAQRYVDGFARLRRDPGDLVFAVVAGVPVELVPAPGAAIAFESILGDPSMQPRPDPSDGSRLVPSCAVAGRGLAFPPRRLVEVGEGLHARGASVSVQSICQADFTPILDLVVDRL
jgi:hypothetical protein